MSQIFDDLDVLYSDTAFGVQVLTFGGTKVPGYFDQEETLQADASGQELLVRRTVFRMKTPLAGSPLTSLDQDSAVSVHDGETDTDTSYVVTDKNLVGDGRETQLVLRPA